MSGRRFQAPSPALPLIWRRSLGLEESNFHCQGKHLTVSNAYIRLSGVHATIYGRGQMVIPAKARKEAGITTGDVVSVEPEGDGRILLTRLEKPRGGRSKIRIRYRKGAHAVATAGRPITSQQVRALLADFP